MGRVAKRLRHEIIESIPPTVYFFLAFQVITFTQALMLKQYGIQVTTFAIATGAALVVSKVIPLADKLPFIDRFPDKPLIYNVLWKTLVYVTAALLVRYVENLFPFFRESGSLAAANRQFVQEIVWPRFWAIQLWFLVLFLVYNAFRELVRVLGRERVLHMFFGCPEPDAT